MKIRGKGYYFVTLGIIFTFLMILASPMILLRNDIQLTLNDIIFVFIHEVNIFRQ